MLSPASAAQAFEVAPDAYDAIALGRETLAQKYAQYEVDWLFGPQSPFTGTTAALARRAGRVRAADARRADDRLFGRHHRPVRRDLEPAGLGGRRRQHRAVRPDRGACSPATTRGAASACTATTTNPHGLTDGSRRADDVLGRASGQLPAERRLRRHRHRRHDILDHHGGQRLGRRHLLRPPARMPGSRPPMSASAARAPARSPSSTAIPTRPLPRWCRSICASTSPTCSSSWRRPGAPGEARPSIWLQLVDPYPQGVPHVGPAGALTKIPVVLPPVSDAADAGQPDLGGLHADIGVPAIRSPTAPTGATSTPIRPSSSRRTRSTPPSPTTPTSARRRTTAPNRASTARRRWAPTTCSRRWRAPPPSTARSSRCCATRPIRPGPTRSPPSPPPSARSRRTRTGIRA